MTHQLAAVSRSDIHSAFDSGNLGIDVAAASVEKVAADAEADCLHTDFAAIRANFTRMRKVRLLRFVLCFNKVNAFAANLLRFGDAALHSKAVFSGIRVEAVQANSDFHNCLFSFRHSN